ncbi:hydrogenase maturation nickel metallochaperone HypA [Halorussus halobius]|uniref:hydrogenase maturation nickel metallochaperone HypA n=1 Tax=Halorussus halobius TaxID=1710537 RepID=UPI0010918D77|nr:hydrogenase maturation nickel metallochaperone HypA [Halorussus halobius]
MTSSSPTPSRGVALEPTDCGERFDEPLGECPNCGSEDVKEVEGFDMAPDS